MKLTHIRIGPRLGAAFGIVLCLFGLTTAVGLSRLAALNDSVRALTQERMVKIDHARDIKDNANVVARAVRNALLTDEPAVIDAEIKRIDDPVRTTAGS